MNYRHLGKAGLKVSELSLGAWLTYGGQVGDDVARECMVTAWEHGVNFFDNAEAYSHGNAELVMGRVLKELGWKRESYVVSTKIFWGGTGPNDSGLSFKHLIEGTNNALRRLQLDYVDLLFAHRPDPETPIEETVRAMDLLIRQGKAFYWGTSEWSAADILRANEIARQEHLTPPSMEQPQYNLLSRERVEVEYAPLYQQLGYGTTIWSPLASGILTGKYNDGIPADSRMAQKNTAWLQKEITPEKIAVVRRLKPIADELGATLAQLSIAWCLMNPHVSTVITGASRGEQVHQNMAALDVVAKLTPEVMGLIEKALAG
jgi:voltage-dependent potassium channel beta subunit